MLQQSFQVQTLSDGSGKTSKPKPAASSGHFSGTFSLSSFAQRRNLFRSKIRPYC
jgi:hypothetical protein